MDVLPDSNNIFGVRFFNCQLIIGKSPIVFSENTIQVKGKEFILTDGLRSLLLHIKPSFYSFADCLTYKQILELTNAHKKKFERYMPINANASWKYVNVISKLFPPKRRFKRKVKGEDNTASGEFDVNERKKPSLTKQLSKYENKSESVGYKNYELNRRSEKEKEETVACINYKSFENDKELNIDINKTGKNMLMNHKLRYESDLEPPEYTSYESDELNADTSYETYKEMLRRQTSKYEDESVLTESDESGEETNTRINSKSYENNDNIEIDTDPDYGSVIKHTPGWSYMLKQNRRRRKNKNNHQLK